MGIRSSYNRATYFAKAAESRPGWVKSGEPYPNQYDVWYGDKAIISGGNDPTQTNVIQYTMISAGPTTDATDFGDLTVARDSGSAGSSATRAIWGGGRTGPPAAEALKDTLDYVEIKSLGNGIDFGDLLAAVRYNTGFSNTNGGVQG